MALPSKVIAIDPGRLCSAEQRSLLFAESHPAVLELPWRMTA